MLSIIIIGKNETQTLSTILAELIKFYHDYKLAMEVIYVDSNSEDLSIETVINFQKLNNFDIKVYKLTGDCNAAIARNIGIKNLDEKSQYIFFLDGDVIPDCTIIPHAIKRLKDDHDCGTITGRLRQYFLNEDSPTLHSRIERNRLYADCLTKHGGNFFCKTALIKQVGMFDERLVKHQDIDLCFRIRKTGKKLIRLDHICGTHYTVPYTSGKRLKSDLSKGNYKYGGVLLRKYLFSSFFVESVKTSRASLIRLTLIFVALLSLWLNVYVFYFSLTALVFFLFRPKKHSEDKCLTRLISLLMGLQFLYGFIIKERKKTTECEFLKRM